MDTENELAKLASAFSEPIDKIKERFEASKEHVAKNSPDASQELVVSCALDAVLAQLQRKYNSKVRVFEGMFLACDGYVNTAAQKEASFLIHGIIIERNVIIEMTLYVTNTSLLNEVILNKPVRFNASRSIYQSSLRMLLRSEQNTRFEYFVMEDNPPDTAMMLASSRFNRLLPADLPTLLKTEKDKDDKDIQKLDKGPWLLQNVIISNILKHRRNDQTYIEITHPDLLGWDITAIFRPIKSDYELVRDKRADLLVKVYRLDIDKKQVVMYGSGYWQKAEFRLLKLGRDENNGKIHRKNKGI